MKGKKVRVSKFSLSKDILIVALQKENEQLKNENVTLREALERVHRNIKGVAKQLSHFAGAKVEPDNLG